MKTFSIYISKSFWAPFIGGISIFGSLLLFGSLFDKLNVFSRSDVGVAVFIKYMAYQIPYFIVKMMPLATLLAVIMALSKMLSSGEWKAGMAGGWRPFDMIKPFLFCSMLVCIFQFALQETVSTKYYLLSEYVLQKDLKNKDDWKRLIVDNVAFSAGNGAIVSCSVFNGIENTMKNVLLTEYDNQKIKSEIYADNAKWNDILKIWVFNDVVKTAYVSGSEIPEVKKYKTLNTAVGVHPHNLVLEELVPEGINIFALCDRINKLQSVGASSVKERTLLWVKISSPLSNIVMALIGTAMALLMTGASKFSGFGAAIGAGFFFWAAMVFGQEAGNAELIQPYLAGLLPIVLFSIISFWGLRKSKAF